MSASSNLIDIKVPDIGDFDEVTVIELLVKPGDSIKADQSLITVESDKASMEIPASQAGLIKEIKVKLGDKVKQGSVVLTLEASGATAAAAAPETDKKVPAAAVVSAQPAINNVASPAPAAAGFAGTADLNCDVLVLGAGPGGYSAAFRAADLGLKVVLVERYATLGGVCLNVGCIPSKALLHVAAVMDEVKHFEALGVSFAEPTVDINKLRTHKEKVVGKLTGGLTAMAKMRKVTVVRGLGQFVGSHHLQVEETAGAEGQEKTGKTQTIAFKNCIIAAGSQAVRLPFMPNDPRVVDSTGALALKEVPKRMLILGGGIIGLEMGTVYSTLGARLDVVEMLDGLMQGADRDLVKVWQKMNAPRFDNIMLKTKTVSARALPEGIEVTFASAEEGGTAPAPQVYDLVLQAVGRTPNGKKLAADKAGVAHQRAAYLRHRRHRRPAHAGAQGGARGPCGGRSHCRRTAGQQGTGERSFQRPRDPKRGLYRPRSGMGGPDGRPGQGPGHQGQKGPVPLDGFGPRDCQRPRRRFHQAAV